MKAVNEGEEGVGLLISVDKQYPRYQVELSPEKTILFIETAVPVGSETRERVTKLLNTVNDLIPRIDFGKDHPKTGQPHHSYRVGRESCRVIYLDLFMGYFEEGFNMQSLCESIENLAINAGARYGLESDNQSFVIRFSWE